MRSPALALGWELWARNRFGLTALGIWAILASILLQVLPGRMARSLVVEATMVLACFGYIYLMWILFYAESTLANNGIGFPPRLFTAPVSTAWLVAWPMLYGVAAMVL